MRYSLNADEVETLYLEKGHTLESLSDYYDIPQITLSRFLRDNNITKRVKRDNLDINEIKSLLKKGLTHQQIADKLDIPRGTLRACMYVKNNINGNNKYSNIIDNEDWIEEDNPIFWYLLGLISADGHFGKGDVVHIYQNNIPYLKNIQSLLKHNGIVSKTGTAFQISIKSKKLHEKLKSFGFTSDKRYSVPFIEPKNNDLLRYYIRGIFDGDGCLHYTYTSGMFTGKKFQITTGSGPMASGLMKSLKSFNPSFVRKESSVGNEYYDIFINKTDEILKMMDYIYSGKGMKYCLRRKYLIYQKLLKLIEIDKLMI